MVYCLCAYVYIIYNIVKFIRTGNQKIYITASQNYYADTNLEAVVEITSKKIIEKGKVKVRLLDSQQKKVKGTKSFCILIGTLFAITFFV